MSSRSTHQMAVKAKDETGGAFASIQSRAAAASAQMRKMLGGALAAAGAYLSVNAISGTISRLGQLSDLAMRAGASVDDMTRAATAFQVAGLNVSVESLAQTLMWMQKNTGKQGMGAFLETAKGIAAIEDGAQRGAELVKNFGRSGLQLLPLVSNGQATVDKFAELAKLMPSVSQSAADAGDAVADAQTILGTGVQTLWQKVVGKVCALWADDFPGGVRAGALNAINIVESMMRHLFNLLTKWGAKIVAVGQAMWNWAANGYSWEQAWKEYGEVSGNLDADFESKMNALALKRKEFVDNLSKKNVNDLANLFGKKSVAIGDALGEAAAKSAARISNDLVLGGSYAAQRMAILGPTFQSETKKQTALLEKIEQNTKSTADGLDNLESDMDDINSTDLGG